MDIWKFLDVANKLLTIIILVGGAIGFFCRTWISEWIKTRFSKAINKELETQKHQLNKELEAYKGSLIRELEQFKANIDIRRSIALKMADARLEALRSLAYELDRFTNECTTWPTLTMELRQHNAKEFNQAVNAMRLARRAAEIFMPLELISEISSFGAVAVNFSQEFKINTEAVLQIGDQRISEIVLQYANIARKLREQIHATPEQLN